MSLSQNFVFKKNDEVKNTYTFMNIGEGMIPKGC